MLRNSLKLVNAKKCVHKISLINNIIYRHEYRSRDTLRDTTGADIVVRLPQLLDKAIRAVTIYLESLPALGSKSISSKTVLCVVTNPRGSQMLLLTSAQVGKKPKNPQIGKAWNQNILHGRGRLYNSIQR